MAQLGSITTCPLQPTLYKFEEFQQNDNNNTWLRSIAVYLAILVALILVKKGYRYVARKHRYARWISSDGKEIVWISGGTFLAMIVQALHLTG